MLSPDLFRKKQEREEVERYWGRCRGERKKRVEEGTSLMHAMHAFSNYLLFTVVVHLMIK